MYRIAFLLLLINSVVFAQYPIKVETGGGAIINTGNAPFLLRSNTFGTVPNTGNSAFLKAKFSKDYDSTKTGLRYGFVIEPYVNAGITSEFILPEAFIKVGWKALEIYGGRRKEIIGLTDTLLTSGSYIWSGNALPLWKVQAGIPDYTYVFKQNLIAVKGAIAHGWFDNHRPVTSDVMLHQKWMYVRLGKPQWKVKIHAGFNHQAQWGGSSPFYSVDGKLPSRLADFPYVFFSTRHADSNSAITNFDGENRIGNHLGTADLGLEFQTSFATLNVYRQNIYEDGSLFFLTNIADGLNGLSINLSRNKWVSRINLEYLSTMSQGGGIFLMGQSLPGELRGKDNYFNHAQYRDGWTYKDRIIGTPYIQTIAYKWDNPEYQIDQNRVQMLQLALAGHLPYSIEYKVKAALAKYKGTYQFPQDTKTLNSFLISLQRPINRQSFVRLDLASDTGTLAPQTIGTLLNYLYYIK
jgi:hypothetical protein